MGEEFRNVRVLVLITAHIVLYIFPKCDNPEAYDNGSKQRKASLTATREHCHDGAPVNAILLPFTLSSHSPVPQSFPFLCFSLPLFSTYSLNQDAHGYSVVYKLTSHYRGRQSNLSISLSFRAFACVFIPIPSCSPPFLSSFCNLSQPQTIYDELPDSVESESGENTVKGKRIASQSVSPSVRAPDEPLIQDRYRGLRDLRSPANSHSRSHSHASSSSQPSLPIDALLASSIILQESD